jgi:tetratricopeptide (TPR) repeat protein
VYRRLDDDIGMARTHFNLANVFERLGRYRDALAHARHSLNLRRGRAADGPLANAYNAVGWYHALLGEYDAALKYCRKALAVHESRHDHHGHAATFGQSRLHPPPPGELRRGRRPVSAGR